VALQNDKKRTRKRWGLKRFFSLSFAPYSSAGLALDALNECVNFETIIERQQSVKITPQHFISWLALIYWVVFFSFP
jgi:hypothetical protein